MNENKNKQSFLENCWKLIFENTFLYNQFYTFLFNQFQKLKKITERIIFEKTLFGFSKTILKTNNTGTIIKISSLDIEPLRI